MPPIVAAAVFVVGVLGLFALDRDRAAQTSKALWIPVIWLLINGSRPVSVWLQMTTPFDSPDQYLEGSPVDRMVFSCLLAAGLIAFLWRMTRARNFLRANAAILLFFGYCAVSVLWSDFPDVAFKRWIKALGDLVMVMIVLTDAQPAAAMKRFLARVGFILLPASILLIKYIPNLGRAYDQWTYQPIVVGVTTNKNTLGLTVLLCGLGAVWRLLEEFRVGEKKDRRRHLIAQGVLLGMTLWLLKIAHSATSVVCFILGSALLVICCFLVKGRKLTLVHLSTLAAVTFPIFALFFNAGGEAVEALGRNSTLTGRTEIWKLVLGMAKNPVFGTGYESFWLGDRLQKLWHYYWFPINEAHNGYIEVYLNLGWIGLALLALFFITGYRNAVATLRRDRGAGGLRLGFIVIAFVYSLTEAGFRMLSPAWIFFLLASSAVPEVLAQENATPVLASAGQCESEQEKERIPASLSISSAPHFLTMAKEIDPGPLKPSLRPSVDCYSKRR